MSIAEAVLKANAEARQALQEPGAISAFVKNLVGPTVMKFLQTEGGWNPFIQAGESALELHVQGDALVRHVMGDQTAYDELVRIGRRAILQDMIHGSFLAQMITDLIHGSHD